MEIIKFLFLFLFISVFSTNGQELSEIKEKGKSYQKNEQYEEAIEEYNKVLDIIEFKKQDSLLIKAGVLNNRGTCFYRQSKYSQAISDFENGIQTYKIIGVDSLRAVAQYQYGNVLKRMGFLNKSLPLYTDARIIFDSLGMKKHVGVVTIALGNIQNKLNNHAQAMDHYREAQQINQELGDSTGLATVYHNMAQASLRVDSLDEAIRFLNQSKILREKLGKSILSNSILFGELYMKQQKYESAYANYRMVLTERLAAKNGGANLASSYWHLGEYYFEINNLEKATYYLDSANFWADSLKDNGILLEIINSQIKIESKNNQSNKMAALFKKKSEIEKITIGLEAQIADAISKNEINLYEKDKEILEQEILIANKETENSRIRFKTQRNLIFFMIALGLSIIIFFFSIRMKKKNKLLSKKNEWIEKTNKQLEIKNDLIEKKNKQLEKKNYLIETLRNELTHRSKNYYEMLSGMLYTDKDNAIKKEVEEILKLYISRVEAMAQVQHHLIVDAVESGQVNLKTYLEELVDNIAIALNHFSPPVIIHKKMDNIQMTYDKAKRIGIAVNELFQNAFKHGFDGIENPEITIQTYKKEGEVFVRIMDNGIGIKEGDKAKKRSNGIRLISELLENIKGELTFENEQEKGVSVRIVFKEKRKAIRIE